MLNTSHIYLETCRLKLRFFNPVYLYERNTIPKYRTFEMVDFITGKESCDTDVLGEFNIIPETPSPVISTVKINNWRSSVLDPRLFRLYNKTHSHKPFIYFEIPKDESILRPLFQPTTVKDDGDLKADLVRKIGNGFSASRTLTKLPSYARYIYNIYIYIYIYIYIH